MNTASTPEITPPLIPAKQDLSKARNIVAVLLKTPTLFASTLSEGEFAWRSALILLLAGLAGHALFGLASGLFGGWFVAAMNTAKMPLAGLCSLLLCFPSLYIFSSVAGTPLSLAQSVLLGCASFAMVGLILVGLAPVAWLFAVSTASISFVTVLTFLLWLIAIGFTSRFLDKLKDGGQLLQQAGIKLWLAILMIVTLQMVTCMRPMLSRPVHGWWTGEKQFFLTHFTQTMAPE